jgi:hypothetical protein
LSKHSGEVPRLAATSDVNARSQLRRRFEVELDLEVGRVKDHPELLPHEPGFVAEEPEGGVPTPRPRMPLSCVPRRRMAAKDLLALPLDHRAGFVLAHVDGTTDIRTLVDVCGMPQEELVEIVDRLVRLQVLELT